ncbi:endo-1,4-beta-xylanase [Alteromonas gracilis]|uniref:endo-1,4-beta-xylanase n=1 Tax=Alteromonas gracilis TaxID=1479524 RepID=UPI0036F4333B
MNRRKFLTTTCSLMLTSTLSKGLLADDKISLKRIASKKNIGFGTAVGKEIYRNARYSNLVNLHCASLTPEDSFKWHQLMPYRNNYSFDESDRLYDYCLQNNFELRGHALIFEKSMRRWLKQCGCSLETDIQRFISTITARYPRIVSWDLFNEIVDHRGYKGWLRKDTLFEKLGASYLTDVARYTHEINPNYELVINEWVGPYSDGYFRSRRNAMLKMLEAFKNMDLPINVFGIQSHLNFAKKDYDRRAWQYFCGEIRDLGYDIKITEIDLSMQGKDRLANNESTVLKYTTQYLEDTLAQGNVKDIICWGLTDAYAYSMRAPDWNKVTYGATPFDSSFEFNILGKALVSALENAPNYASVSA